MTQPLLRLLLLNGRTWLVYETTEEHAERFLDYITGVSDQEAL
jgi:hypothetical protein